MASRRDGRTFLDRFLPAAAWRERPWFGWLVMGSAALFALFLLFSLGLVVVVIDSVFVRGASVLGSAADGNPGGAYTLAGMNLGRLWLLGTLACVPIMLTWVWWHHLRGDRPRAVHKDMEAARAGSPEAAFQVARHYLERDPSAARVWLLRAAQAGLPEAMVELGRDLREGRGGPRDLVGARAWLQHACASEASGAAELLGEVEAQLADRFSIQGR